MAVLTNGVVTGITITSGGSGYTSAPTVTLTNTDLGNYHSESVWDSDGGSTGGGISNYESQPAYQQGLVIHNGSSIISANGKRTTPDVAFDADPNTGVVTYDSYNGEGGNPYGLGTNIIQIGGTSVGAPSWAGLIAIADQIRRSDGFTTTLTGATQALPILYSLYNDSATYSQDFHDITSGSNGTYSAGTGYDLDTGIGSPIANELLPALGGALAYTAPSGTNSFLLQASGSTLQLLDNGSVVASGPLAKTTSVVIVGGTNNSLTINYTNLPTNLMVSFTGGTGSGTRSLTLENGAFTNKTYSYTSAASGTINLDGETVIFTAVSTVADTTTQSNIAFNLPTGAQASLQDNGNASDGIAEITSLNSSFVTTTFEDPGTSLTVTTAGGSSQVQLAAMDNGFKPTTETFSGVSGDTVQFETATAIASSTSVNHTTVALDLHGFSPTIDALSGNGTITDSVSTGSTLTVGTNNDSGVFSGVIQNGGGTVALVKNGTGSLTLSGADTYTGATAVNGGSLFVDGSLASAVTVAQGATLAGSAGTLSAAVVVSGKLSAGDTASPTGLLSVGNLSFGSGGTLAIVLDGTAAGSGFDRITSAGSINLTGATLNLSVGNGFAPVGGTAFDILVNNGVSAITGTFTGLAEGATVTIDGDTFKITYVGGTSHHDVVLTAVTPTTTTLTDNGPNASTFGQLVTFTINVSGSPANNGETVSLEEGNAVVGTGTLNNGTATVTVSNLTAGTHNLFAVYPGDATLPGSQSGTVMQVVNPAPTTVTASNQTAAYSSANQNVTLSATVSSTTVVVNEGTVTFTVFQGNTQVGSAAVSGTVANGIASASYLLPGGSQLGTYTIVATYNPGSDFTGNSDNTHMLTVTMPIAVNSVMVNGDTAPIISATESTDSAGTTVTINTDGAHGFSAGQVVSIAGVNVSGYNGVFSITNVTSTSFTYTATASGLAAGSGGTATTNQTGSGILAGAQRSMVDSIVYQFDQAVNLGSNAFTIGLHPGVAGNATSVPTLSWASTDGGVTWIVTFSGSAVLGNSIANGVYDITLNNGAVSAVAGGGTLAQSRLDTFYRLYGDLGGQQAVNTTDRVIFNAASSAMVGAANYFAAFDAVDVGQINTIDRILFNVNSGKTFGGVATTI